MNFTIIATRQANSDVWYYGNHIAKDDLVTGLRFVEAIEETIEDIARNPGLGMRWETANPQFQRMRWRPVKEFSKYLVFYRKIDDAIEVIRLCHISRDLQRLFE